MAKKTKKSSAGQKISRSAKIRNAFSDPSFRTSMGLLLIGLSILLTASFISYFFSWESDFSEITNAEGDWLSHPASQSSNWLGKAGAYAGHLFIYRWFGISAFLWCFFLLNLGMSIAFQKALYNNFTAFKHILFGSLYLSLFFGAFSSVGNGLWAGGLGHYTYLWTANLLGGLGTAFALITVGLIYLTLTFGWTSETFAQFGQRFKRVPKTDSAEASPQAESSSTDMLSEEVADHVSPIVEESAEPVMEVIENAQELPIQEEEIPEPVLKTTEPPVEEEPAAVELAVETPAEDPTPAPPVEDDVAFEVEAAEEEEVVKPSEIKKSAKDFGDYDPKLDLSRFKLPPLDLLKEYGNSNITINQEELEANKQRIKETLSNYNIGIDKITATIGPTVTLYEIVPSAGVRISKIKNLEDDIALSLAALGIRIIAPIPGRGTIGIEVPNTDPKTVSMKAVVASEKFQNTDMELPVAMGKTISNQTFVFDLAKMPHLLMAGATGQGKSVGLNAILTSILYKKHPSQVKFVLVDPKKVELTLFNKIERHYLAKLPDSEDAIITDTTKVVNTINSLCIEMDNRYDLLKTAMCRNIKEYNAKFIARKLNPNDGHRYLPYIVLVIDEFADLIMTAGKEVETPIARLAQLARAIGIHLIVATQRPSVNVITGIIKANFPARIAFRVTSKIDSRTILDAGGADQLIGRGDMLMSMGSDLTRIQCAFVDTPEVEEITDFIGNQQAYPEAYQLPEYVGEDGGGNADGIDIADRDSMFLEAAKIVVIHQQGSASLLQRKLKLGYNRAGRIVDQLEAAGIIGPFEGSKARQVLIPDEVTLERLLENESLK